MNISHEYDISFENEEFEHRLKIEASVNISHDTYGEDGDGNRSVVQKEAEVKSIVITNQNGDDVTDLVQDQYSDDYQKICEEVEQKALEA